MGVPEMQPSTHQNCRAVCRGVARQKVMDETGSYSSRPLTKRYLSSVVNSKAWTDRAHEEDGGHDQVGPRPQDGRRIMEEEMQHKDWGQSWAEQHGTT